MMSSSIAIGIAIVVLLAAGASAAPATLMPAATCTNNGPPPGSSYSCAQQKAWGKCSAPWMKGYCCSVCDGGGGGGNSTAKTIVTTLGCGNCHSCGLESPNSVRAHMESLFNQACDGLGCSSDERAVRAAVGRASIFVLQVLTPCTPHPHTGHAGDGHARIRRHGQH